MYAEVESLFEDRKGRAHVSLQWLYKPEDVVDGRQPHHGEFELFRSEHIDPNRVEMMLGHANVLSGEEYQKYLKERKKKEEEEAKNEREQKQKEKVVDDEEGGGSEKKKKKREPPVFFVKRFYNHREGTFTACEWEGVKADSIIDDLPSDGDADGDDDDEDEQETYGGHEDRKDGDYMSGSSGEEADEDEKVVVILEDEKPKRGKRKREPAKATSKETKKEPAGKKRKVKEKTPSKGKEDDASEKPKRRGPGRPRKKRPGEEEEEEEPEEGEDEPDGPVGRKKAKKIPTPSSKEKKKPSPPPSNKAADGEGADQPKKEISIHERLQKLAGEPNQSDLVKQLLAAGADPRFNANPSTSLQQCSVHFAAAFGRADTLRLLLDHDNNLANVLTRKGWSPLHYATHNKHLDAVKVLLEYLADPFQKTTDGKSALDIAKTKNTTEIVEALQKAIAVDESVAELHPS